MRRAQIAVKSRIFRHASMAAGALASPDKSHTSWSKLGRQLPGVMDSFAASTMSSPESGCPSE
jgi:hypothetical protein